MTKIPSLTDVQSDALCEVANIGAGHAATALSQMTGTTVMISVPRITVVSLIEIFPATLVDDESAAIVSMALSGSMHGNTLLVLPIGTARRIASLVLHRDVGAHVEFDSMETSVLTEVGNILTGAYVTALSEFLRMRLLPSPPTFVCGLARPVLLNAIRYLECANEWVICVETQFMVAHVDDQLRGYFLLLPDDAAFDALLAAVRVD